MQRQHEQGDPANVRGLVNTLGSYRGKCIIETFGGAWTNENSAWIVAFDASNSVRPFTKVHKHLENGSGHSILSFFCTIQLVFKGVLKPQ